MPVSRPPSLRKESFFLYGGAVLVFLAVALGATLGMVQLREAAMGQMHTTTRNLATSINQTLDGLIDTIDVALLATADEISRQYSSPNPDKNAINDYLGQSYRAERRALLQIYLQAQQAVAFYGAQKRLQE